MSFFYDLFNLSWIYRSNGLSLQEKGLMGIEIGHLSADDYTKSVSNDEQNFVTDDLILMRNGIKVTLVGELGKPYRIEEGRILRITSGKATYQINMLDYDLDAFTVIGIPAGSIIMIKEYSDDFNLQAMSIKDLQEEYAFDSVWTMRLGNDDWQRMSAYTSLIWQVVHKRELSMDTVRHLQMAMLNDLRNTDATAQKGNPAPRQSRVQHEFSEFVKLVNKYGYREHRIPFYADKLFVTPNHLSTLVKQQSGETAAGWINRAIILEAKVLLRHSDLKNYEIAERLNFPNASFFNKFFKKQTGQTPLEYKES